MTAREDAIETGVSDDIKPEWIEVGAQALVGGTNYVMSGDSGSAGTMNRLTSQFVITAAAPLIRADQIDACGLETLAARDRTRYGSDAWSRLDRLANDMFRRARVLRKELPE